MESLRVITKIIVCQGVKGVRITSTHVTADTPFRAYINATARQHTLELYGVVNSPILFNDMTLSRYIVSSEVNVNQRTGVVFENTRKRIEFSEETEDYTFPDNTSIVPQSITVKGSSEVKLLDDSLFVGRLHTSLSICVSEFSKIAACPRVKLLELVLKDGSTFDGRRSISFRRSNDGSPGGTRVVSLALSVLELTIFGASIVKGVSVKLHLQLKLFDNACKFKIGVVRGCTINYSLRGVALPVEDLPVRCSISELEPPISATQHHGDDAGRVVSSPLPLVSGNSSIHVIGNGSVWLGGGEYSFLAGDSARSMFEEAILRSTDIAASTGPTEDMSESYTVKRAPTSNRNFTVTGNMNMKAHAVDDSDTETLRCVVCTANARVVILFPCGHTMLCPDCAPAAETNIKLCPECREPIISAVIPYNFSGSTPSPVVVAKSTEKEETDPEAPALIRSKRIRDKRTKSSNKKTRT